MNMYMHWFVLYHVRWICLGSFASLKCSARREVSDKPDIIDRFYLRVQIYSFYCDYRNAIPISFLSCSSSLLWENFKHILLLLTVSEEMSKSEKKEKETEREIGERRTEEGEGRGEIRTASQSGNKILCSTRTHLYSHLHTRTLAIRQMFFFFFLELITLKR